MLREEEKTNEELDNGPPLDNSIIHWKLPDDRIVLFELFGGIGNGLATVLQVGIKVQRYICIDIDDAARQVSRRHMQGLKTQFPELLATSAIISSFSTLVGNIFLLPKKDIQWLGHVELALSGHVYGKEIEWLVI